VRGHQVTIHPLYEPGACPYTLPNVRILLLNRPPVNGFKLSGRVYLGDEMACTQCNSLHSQLRRNPHLASHLEGIDPVLGRVEGVSQKSKGCTQRRVSTGSGVRPVKPVLRSSQF
jgi:hypothetical protein